MSDDAVPSAPTEPTAPLSGIVVADLTRVLAGPYATMLLADLGARVIKIEGPGGDDTRSWAPPERDGESTYFLTANRGKRSICLDLADAAERAIAHRIVARSDVLVENFRPGALRRFGLDYESLAPSRPDLVYASITGFGDEAGRDLPGYDLLAQAVSGMMDLTGRPDGAPTKVGAAVVDVVTGLHATIGILAALRERDRSGRGDRVRVDLLTSALSALVNQTSAVLAGGITPRRMGNAHPSLTPYEPVPTADDDIVIAVGNDAQFRRLCAVLGDPALADDDRYATMRGRNLHRETLRERLCALLAARRASEWFALLRARGVPAAPILSIADGVRLADDLGLHPVAHSGTGGRRIPTMRHPVAYDRAGVDYALAPPSLDADRSAVLSWLNEG